MTLSYSFEKLHKGQNQVIEITAEVSKRREIEDLGYDDFNVNLFIGGKLIGDISPVLAKAGVLEQMIDGIDWYQLETSNNY